MSRRQLGFGLGALLMAGRTVQGTFEASAQGPSWEQIVTGEPGPAPRWDHTLAAHDSGKQLILFGGRESGGASLGDTWVFSRTRETWSMIEGQGPSARFGHAVATDQEGEVLYLFGGQSADQFFNDLWQLDMSNGTWAQLSDGSGVAPSPRYGTSLVLTSEGRLVVSHGFTFEGRFDDTWSYDLGAGGWVDISPESDLVRPLKRCLHEAIWAEDVNRMVLFGGCSSGFGPCPQGDLWEFEPPTRIWTERSMPSGPSARSNPALVYDDGRKQALLIGGLTDSGYAADVWSLSLHDDEDPAWSSFDLTGPTPRASHDAAITGPWLYLFGGTGDAGPLNDLWVIDVRELEVG